jgi:presqualene diphosphate synthase
MAGTPTYGMNSRQFDETGKDLDQIRDAANLVVASQLFDCPIRRESFTILYSVMRKVDDLVDSISERDNIDELQKDTIRSEVLRWEHFISDYYRGEPCNIPTLSSVYTALDTFQIPKILWDNFFESMWFDFNEEEILSFEDFLKYAEGASVAATTIYLTLIGAEKKENRFETSNFNYIELGHLLGIWAYAIHIVRDLKSDLKVGSNGRLTIPASLVHQFDLDKTKLRRYALDNIADPNISGLVSAFLQWSGSFGIRGKSLAIKLAELLPLERQIILCLIVAMYHNIARRIELSNFNVFDSKHVVLPEERHELVVKIRQSKSWLELEKYWK